MTTFVGASRNALHIRIWTAIIALLLKYLQLKVTFGWSLSNVIALLALESVRVPRSVDLGDDPLTAPPPLPEPVQAR